MSAPGMGSSSDRDEVLRYDTLRNVLPHSKGPFWHENSKLPQYGIQRPWELPVNGVEYPTLSPLPAFDIPDRYHVSTQNSKQSRDLDSPPSVGLSEETVDAVIVLQETRIANLRRYGDELLQLGLENSHKMLTEELGKLEADLRAAKKLESAALIDHGTFGRHGSDRMDEYDHPGTRESFSHDDTAPTHTFKFKFPWHGTRPKPEILRTSRHQPQTKIHACVLCNDHPKGFHGEHDLRRHIERYHPDVRKVWICRDSPDSQIQPIVPLASCRACRTEKPYDANYNAAAHLRRAHFHPCKNKRGGRGVVYSDLDGMGGGDELPVDELENWMFEKEEIDVSPSVELQNISQLVVSRRRKDLISDAPPRAPDNKSASLAYSTSKPVDSAIGLSRRFEGSTGGTVAYEHLFGDGSLSEHRSIDDFDRKLHRIGVSTTDHDSARDNYSALRDDRDYPISWTPCPKHLSTRLAPRPPSYRAQSDGNSEDYARTQTSSDYRLRSEYLLQDANSPEISARRHSGLAVASDARSGFCEENSTPTTQSNASMPITSPPEEENPRSQGHSGLNTPQPKSRRSSSQSYSLPGVPIIQEAVDAKKEKAPQSSSATPESEGENSFVEGWEDHQSPGALAVENENLFTNICDILSRQLTDTYVCGLRVSQNDVQLGVPGYNSCAGSDSSTAVSQKSKDTNAVSQTTAPTTELPLSKKRDPDHGDDDEQSRDQKRQKPRLSCAEAQGSDGRLLACPYFKFDPTRYSERNMLVQEQTYRGCSSCVLRDISRLKQHLYRVHRRPEHYCGRCSEEFASQDALDTHTRAETRCDAADPRYPEKMTSNQLTCIKRKKPGRNLQDTWYIIFKILFPDAPLPTSPFAECVPTDAIASFIVHAERQGPALLSGLISTDLQNLPFYREHDRQIVEEAIERAFPQVIRELSRGFSQFSSQSDVRSSQSGLASSSALGEIRQPVAPRDAALRSTLNTTSALFDPDQSAPLEPPQGYYVLTLDHQSQADFSAYQDLSVGEAAQDWSFAPFTNTLADDEAFLTQNESLTRHADPQSEYWGMPYPSDIDEAHNTGDNIYQSNQWPNGGSNFPAEE